MNFINFDDYIYIKLNKYNFLIFSIFINKKIKYLNKKIDNLSFYY